MKADSYKLILGDCLEKMKDIPDASIDCVISSPPYWQLRDYGYSEQWGLERTFQEYLEKLWALMDEVKRALKPTGTAWINLGDTYGSFRGKSGSGADKFEREKGIAKRDTPKHTLDRPSFMRGQFDKCLLLIPHRFAIGCIDRGWIVRNDIVWAKRNAMPESVTDRFSKKHEYFFLMTKQTKYYFDLDSVKDPHLSTEKEKQRQKRFEGSQGFMSAQGKGLSLPKANSGGVGFSLNGKNPGDVADFWDIPTRPNSEKHYATFNTELIDKPIKAGCPIGGTVLDMFCGTATTGIRALQLDRKFIGIDGSAEYLQIAQKRISEVLNKEPLLQVAHS